jgi:hypothetical protein
VWGLASGCPAMGATASNQASSRPGNTGHVWSLDLASAQTIELKSLILAQIERWRRA